jgi:hypothetical protein
MLDIEEERRKRFRSLRLRAERDIDAIFAAVGLESWALGAQLIAVTIEK